MYNEHSSVLILVLMTWQLFLQLHIIWLLNSRKRLKIEDIEIYILIIRRQGTLKIMSVVSKSQLGRYDF